jgi:hypothetical protein
LTDAIASPVSLPPGRVGLRLRLFDAPSEELSRLLRPPWPRWMRRLYELEEATSEHTDVGAGVVSASAAVAALKESLRKRLDVLSWCLDVLESLGWELELEGDVLLATAAMTPAEARRQLEDAGAAGPMCLVSDLDDAGWPRVWSADAGAAG